MDRLRRDVRHGLRLLTANPGFATAAILTLALGIGGSTAMWSLVYGVLIRPLPYPEADRIVSIREGARSKIFGVPTSFATTSRTIEAWRDDTETLEYVAGYRPRSYTLTGRGDPARVEAATVSPSLFPLLGAVPARGRFFSPDEERAGADRVVILSYRFWRDRFGADPGAVGAPILLDGMPHEIIGVAPEQFHFPDPSTELWTPFVLSPPDLAPGNFLVLPAIARLRDGVSGAAAEAEGSAVLAGVYQKWSAAAGSELTPPALHLIPLRDDLAAEVRIGLRVLMVAVASVLLLGCVNLANLLLARETSRAREVAIRRALGASSLRLARQSLTETSLLAAAGGAGGIAIAYGLVRLLPVLVPSDLPRLAEVRLDASALAFAGAISLGSAAIVGLAPAWRNSRTAAVQPLLSSRPEERVVAAAASGRSRAGNALAVAEIAVAAMLLSGAALLIQSLIALVRVDLGYRPQGVLSASLYLPSTKYADRSRSVALLDAALEDLSASRRVQAAGLVTLLPLTEGWGYYRFPIEGRPIETDPRDWVVARPQTVSAGYLDAMRLRLVAGRWLDHRDDGRSARVVIVNQEFVRRFLAGEDPMRHRLLVEGTPAAIAGVVADVRQAGGRDVPFPEIYLSYRQWAGVSEQASLVIRTFGDPRAFVPELRAIVRGVDPDLPLADVATMDDRLSASVGRPRFYARLLGVFSGLALFLAASGIYGVLSVDTLRRRRELGIRRALGATDREIVRMVLHRGLRLTAIGLALGLAASIALSRTLESLLFGVGPAHAPTFVAVFLLLGSIALLACYLPARRANRVAPAEALRSE